MAAVAWRMFRDRPLLGCGWGQYQNACAYYLFDRSTELPLERARYYIQHNVFLGLLCETGLLGAVPFCVLLLMWTRDAWGLWRDQRRPLFVRQQGLLALAVLITYAENGLFHDVSVIAMVNMLLFLVAGVTSGLAASTSGALAASAVAPARSVRNPVACANAT
jgi:O-antigen ligase